jgi:SPP1 family predicted phage head-tail adaptor
MFSDVIELITYIETQGELGQTNKTPDFRRVYAQRKSVRQSEFYQAATAGMKPEIAFDMRVIDYNQEEKLKYNGGTFRIIRTYQRNTEMIELICESVVADV